jgi:hypothetical protein
MRNDSNKTTYNVDKKGHEYVWTRFKETVDPDDSTKRQVMSLDIHVARFYPEASFAALDLPTTWT